MAQVINFRARPTFESQPSHVRTHPSMQPRIYDREDEDLAPTIMVALSPLSASLIVRALSTSSMAAARELAVELRDELRSRRVIDVGPEGA